MSDPKGDLHEELRLIIQAAQMWHPRSQQRAIGPSQAGGPCERKLGYAIADHPRARDDTTSWRATVGVSIHAWVEKHFQRVLLPDGTPRFLTEQRVMCGSVGDEPMWGTCDLYDKATATVIDIKTMSPTSMRTKRAQGPGVAYRTQVHLYALGLLGAGHPVESVAIFGLPTNGELSDSILLVEPFDITVALDALARANRIAAALDALPAATVLEGLDTAEEWCARSCAWFRPGSTDVTSGCPGHTIPDRAKAAAGQLAGLLPA